MSYAAQDQASAVSDLIAFDGELIEVGGHKYRAHIERGAIGQDGSIYGLDNREESVTATLVHRGTPPAIKDDVLLRGKRYRITEINPEGELVASLSLTND